MHNKLACFILSLFVAVSAAAHNIEITVKLGNEPAEYAFVLRNSKYIGTCDSQGVLILDGSIFEQGDTLSAIFAGVGSDHLLFKERQTSYGLKVATEEISTSTVETDGVNLLDEYLRLISKIKYRTVLYGDRYQMTYERSECHGDSLVTAAQGLTTLALLHRQKSKDDEYWQKINAEDDSLETSWAAFGLNYANQIMMLLTSKKVLKEYYGDKRLLIHKTVSACGDLCYIFLEGDNRDNQTMVRFNDKDTEIQEVSRSFLGGGSLIVSSDTSLHTVKIALNTVDKSVCLDRIAIEAYIPKGDIRYHQSYSDLKFLGR